jgi:PmbA protein
MSQELLEQAREVVQKATKLGAQGVRASLGRSRNSSVEWRDRKLDRVRESTRMSLGVTLFMDGRYSSNSTSDLRPQAIDTFLARVVDMTRVLAKDPHRKLPAPERYDDRFEGELGLYDQAGSAAATAIQRRKTAIAMEEAARTAPGAEKLISVESTCSDSVSESALVTSNGMEGVRHSSRFTLYVQTSVRDRENRKPEGYEYAVSRHRANLPPLEKVGKEATRRALQFVGAGQEKSGEYACIIENRNTRRLLGWLLMPMNGWAIQQKRSFLADKKDQQVLGDVFTMTDDPHVIEGLGSRAYDYEGMSTRMMPVFDKGVLRDFYLDTYYASKLGKTPTTGSSTNLVFPAGDKDLPALLREMGTGILVTGFSGGNSNMATGDFSVGIRGMWVENGSLVRPVTEMNLAGNHLTFWKNLAEFGNDPNPSSSWMCPSMRFGKVQFSGA